MSAAASPEASAPSSPGASSASTPDAAAPEASAVDAGGSTGDAPAAPAATAGAASAAAAAPAAATAPDIDGLAPDASTIAAAAADGASPEASESGSAEASDGDDAISLEEAAPVAGAAVAAGAAALLGKPGFLPTHTPGGATPGAPTKPGAPSGADGSTPSGSNAGAGAPDGTTGASTPDGSAPSGTPDGAAPDGAGQDDGATPDGNSSERTLEEIDQALGEINPNYDPSDPANGYATNCGNTSSILNDFLNGTTSSEAPTGTLDVAQMEARTGNPQTPMTPAQIDATLRELGAGSHCVVGIDRSTGDGHWFNAYFDGTTVWSLDAQTGTRTPWPPHEPNATNWDASIQPEHVTNPDGTKPNAPTPDAGTPDGGAPQTGHAAAAAPAGAGTAAPSAEQAGAPSRSTPSADPAGGPWSPEMGDPVLSGADHGPSWSRVPDHASTSPIDPDFGEVRAPGESGSLADPYAHPGTVPAEIAHLITDPDAPYGRADDGTPYRRDEWEARYTDADGRPVYPGNHGATPGTFVEYSGADALDAFMRDYGDELDRMGGPGGDFLSFPGTPFEARSLPPSNLSDPYSIYRLGGALPVGTRIEVSEIAPAFGRDGGGLQVRLLDAGGNALTVDQLISDGSLTRTEVDGAVGSYADPRARAAAVDAAHSRDTSMASPSPRGTVENRGGADVGESVSRGADSAAPDGVSPQTPNADGGDTDAKSATIDVDGIGSSCQITTNGASAAAIEQAQLQAGELFGSLAAENRALLDSNPVIIDIIPEGKKLTDIPEYGHLAGKQTFDGRDWADVSGIQTVIDGRIRVAVQESGLLEQTGGYGRGFLAAHEGGHAIQAAALTPAQLGTLETLYAERVAAHPVSPNGDPAGSGHERWLEPDWYSAANKEEYFGNSVAAYHGRTFGQWPETVAKYNRSWLEANDPGMFDLLESLYGSKGTQ